MECKLSEAEISSLSSKVLTKVIKNIQMSCLYDAQKKQLQNEVEVYMQRVGTSVGRSLVEDVLEDRVEKMMVKQFKGVDKLIEKVVGGKVEQYLASKSLTEQSLAIAREKVREIERALYGYSEDD